MYGEMIRHLPLDIWRYILSLRIHAVSLRIAVLSKSLNVLSKQYHPLIRAYKVSTEIHKYSNLKSEQIWKECISQSPWVTTYRDHKFQSIVLTEEVSPKKWQDDYTKNQKENKRDYRCGGFSIFLWRKSRIQTADIGLIFDTAYEYFERVHTLHRNQKRTLCTERYHLVIPTFHFNIERWTSNIGNDETTIRKEIIKFLREHNSYVKREFRWYSAESELHLIFNLD